MAREHTHGSTQGNAQGDAHENTHGATTADTAGTAMPYGRPVDDSEARERFGGINWGAAFFGWLVAIALTILLTSIAGAVTAAVSDTANVTQTQAERQAGTIGIAAGVVLLVVLAIGYYAGGYVAGRMSRFDGGRQGLAVWLIGRRSVRGWRGRWRGWTPSAPRTSPRPA